MILVTAMGLGLMSDALNSQNNLYLMAGALNSQNRTLENWPVENR